MVSSEQLTLPAGWRARPPGLDDLQALTDMQNEKDVADRGEPDTDIDDVRADWRRSGFDLARDAVLLIDPNGALAGYSDVHLQERWAMIAPSTAVLPQYRALGLERMLLEWAESRAIRQALENGRAGQLTMRAVSIMRRQDALFEALGYRAVRWDHRMHIDLPEQPPPAEWPAEFTVRTLQPGERDERAAYTVVDSAFRDTDPERDHPFEAWHAWIIERSDYDPTLTFLVEREGQVVGTALCFNYDGLGWVRQLAVLRPYRRLGIGQSILQHAFGEFYRRGCRAAELVVDTNNPTGAPKLYEQAGMRPVEQFIYFTKEIPLPPPA